MAHRNFPVSSFSSSKNRAHSMNTALSAFAARKSLQNKILKKTTSSRDNQSTDISSGSIPVSPAEDVSFDLGPQDTIALDSRPAVPALRSVTAEIALEDPADDPDSSYVVSSLTYNGIICTLSNWNAVFSLVVNHRKRFLRQWQSHYLP